MKIWNIFYDGAEFRAWERAFLTEELAKKYVDKMHSQKWLRYEYEEYEVEE